MSTNGVQASAVLTIVALPENGAPAANAVCNSKPSSTPGCRMDCKIAKTTLNLSSLSGTVTIVNAEYPPGTAVTFTANSVTFTPQKGINNLMVSYAFLPDSARAKLAEACTDQPVWDNNVNSSVNPVPYAVCA